MEGHLEQAAPMAPSRMRRQRKSQHALGRLRVWPASRVLSRVALSSRVRKLFWVVTGRTYGLEFWHLLHRHAGSTGLADSLAQPYLVL